MVPSHWKDCNVLCWLHKVNTELTHPLFRTVPKKWNWKFIYRLNHTLLKKGCYLPACNHNLINMVYVLMSISVWNRIRRAEILYANEESILSTDEECCRNRGLIQLSEAAIKMMCLDVSTQRFQWYMCMNALFSVIHTCINNTHV